MLRPLELRPKSVAAPNLTEYTRAALIVPRLQQTDTAGIISELSQVLQREGCVADVLPFYHAALNRELLASSAVESGLAFPHARLSGVKQLQFALGRAVEPVIWGARAQTRVEWIFLLAVPATDAAGYLHLLASLARLGSQPDLLQMLREAADGDAILGVLGRVKLRCG